jgi:hypothetical protein
VIRANNLRMIKSVGADRARRRRAGRVVALLLVGADPCVRVSDPICPHPVLRPTFSPREKEIASSAGRVPLT